MLSFLKLNFKTHKALIALYDRPDVCFVTNISDIENFLSFCVDAVRIVEERVHKHPHVQR
jgi:hypothetical protein